MAQLVKNPPAVRETWVQSLGGEDPLEKGTATHSSNLAWRIPWTVKVPGVAKSWTGQSDFHFPLASSLPFPTAGALGVGSPAPSSADLITRPGSFWISTPV